jgi:hypothetical protein
MNLGKLLGAGKSFFSGRSSVSYREKKGVYLPKFGGGKNPFTPKAESPAEEVPAKKNSVISAPVAAPRPVRAANWAGKLNPFRALTPPPMMLAKAEQVEFSLDAVKVLHNDLSDAEVEVVPVKSQTVAPVVTSSEYIGEQMLRAA